MDILASLSGILPPCYLCGDTYHFRFNSIDVKYQVWKLGVVFTDNVSSGVINGFVGQFGCVCPVEAKKVSPPAIYTQR